MGALGSDAAIETADVVLMLGIATMWEAVFGDIGVALIAVFNAIRILRG